MEKLLNEILKLDREENENIIESFVKGNYKEPNSTT